ncbi:hypothetical protein [Niveispirillum irakense]|uniref:hypothetical protein n=1 Tax=Niveispirillum irakense TaxID=34011 RepID=UPI0012B5ED67|nr:hypothetical protein [Niveispirillum irakense]
MQGTPPVAAAGEHAAPPPSPLGPSAAAKAEIPSPPPTQEATAASRPPSSPPIINSDKGTPPAPLPGRTPAPSEAPAATGPDRASPTATAATPSQQTAAPEGPAVTRPLLPPLPNGQPVQVRILGVGPAPIPADAGPTQPATLVGTTSQGQPVVTTAQGTMVLKARTDLPPGTPLTVSVELPATRSPAQMLPPLDPVQGQDWPVLKEVMAVIAASDPMLARTIAQQVMPQPNKRLTTNLTFLLAALRGGDVGGWLGGEATQLLERKGAGPLLARLREDFLAAAQQATEPAADGWRSMPIPFGSLEAMQRLQLHVRSATDQDQSEDGRGENAKAQRFLLDLTLSRLGPMQLDGMVWPGRFDLMIRTRDLLPAELRQAMGDIFRSSLENVGFGGTIAFQTGAHFWVRAQGSRRALGGQTA